MRLLILAVAVCLPMLSAAETATSRADSVDMDLRCKIISDVAGSIMKRRQREASLANWLSRTDEDSYLRPIIEEAYRQPALAYKADQQRAIDEFANRWTIRCYNGEVYPTAVN